MDNAAFPPASAMASAPAISLLSWQWSSAMEANIIMTVVHIRFIFFRKSMCFDASDCTILKKILQIFLFFKMLKFIFNKKALYRL